MPTNVTPEYRKAEKAFQAAKTIELIQYLTLSLQGMSNLYVKDHLQNRWWFPSQKASKGIAFELIFLEKL